MSYTQLNAIAYLIVILYMIFVMRKKTSLKITIVSILTIVVSITIFARIFWVINTIEYFIDGTFGIEELFWMQLGEFKIIGVLIGAIVAIALLCKIFKKDAKLILNSGVEAMFLGAGYTKVVCTIVGCCRGKATTLPWAISYPAYEDYNVHPTALYEVITWWLCFALLHILKKKINNDATRISIVVMIYVLIRMFLLEGLYAGTEFMGSITARITYFTIIAICIIIIIFNQRKNKSFKK